LPLGVVTGSGWRSDSPDCLEAAVEDEEQLVLEAGKPERSIHEAGHVVVLLHHEFRVVYTTIIPTDEWAGHTEAPGLRFSFVWSIRKEEVRKHAEVVCAAAAAIAISNDEADIDFDTARELFSGGDTLESRGGDWGLFCNCIQVLIREDVDDPESRSPFDKRSEEVWEGTLGIIKSHRPSVEALARALLEKGRLEEEDILEIWRATAGN
jgi:hypothetical protein